MCSEVVCRGGEANQAAISIEDELFTLCEILDPVKAFDIVAVTLLQKILQRYKAPSWDAQKIIEEWRSLLMFDLPDVKDVCDFWLHVASLKTPMVRRDSPT